MKFKDKIKESMTWLSKQPKVVFLGEGLKNANSIYGTLEKVSEKRCLEMPIAENLIASVGVGLAITGFLPILVFQRMDFMLIAADALINHAALIPKMSNGKIKVPLIIRAIIGSKDPKFDVGPQHNHDFTHIFKPYMDTWVFEPDDNILSAYQHAYKSNEPMLLIERKDDYERDCSPRKV